MQEQVDAKIPDFLRRETPLPCERHGNPADISAASLAWLSLYDAVKDYSTVNFYEDPNNKKKAKRHEVLNVPVLKILCEELQIDFLEAFETLTSLVRTLNAA